MNINRRDFIKDSSILLSGIFLYNGLQTSVIGNNKFQEIKVLRDKFGVYTEKGGTIGWFKDGDEVVVIDSQFPDSAENFMNEMKQKSVEKINYLFNTHHHNDHTKGNLYLKNFAENIVSHANCPRLQLQQKKADENIITADITFREELKIKLKDEQLTAIHFGQAHTGGDIVIHFENINVAHLGDLVFNQVYPYIDNMGECSVENWGYVLEDILDYFDDDTKFIFGHAATDDLVIGNKNDVRKKKEYLESLYNFVSGKINDGKSVEEIAELDEIPGSNHLKEKWEGARKMNLRATAEQLL
jgi:glyoxylase-like metal-dependent hydrolase (beta-lactamase superfamily II)